MAHTNTRADFQLITNWVEPNSRVLDLGCGDGSLLALLNRTRATRGYGVEINDDNIVTCVKTASTSSRTIWKAACRPSNQIRSTM